MLCTVIRHVEIEDLGHLDEALARANLPFRYLDAESLTGLRQPETDALAALIVLGGPMGVYEADRYPYLATEIELIRRQLQSRQPILGICLGAQLLAAAAGARIYPGPAGKEIGWADVELTEAGATDRLIAGFRERFNTFHWHGDTFDLPPEAVALARNDKYLQAFRIADHAYGVQFHPEVVPERLEAWIRDYQLELERERLPSEAVLRVPDRRSHQELSSRFASNVADWLRGQLSSRL